MMSYLAASTGFTIYLPDYRLAPEHFYPSQLEDGVTCFKSLINDFLITDNEMFTARQKGISYYLLLIVQSGEALPSHYSLINYPLPMLNEKVERRAVKHERRPPRLPPQTCFFYII